MTPRECGAWTRHRLWWGRIRDALTVGHVYHVCDLERPGFLVSHTGDHRCEDCGLRWPLSLFERLRARA